MIWKFIAKLLYIEIRKKKDQMKNTWPTLF